MASTCEQSVSQIWRTEIHEESFPGMLLSNGVNRSHITPFSPSTPIPISTYCYPLKSPYSIPRPCTRFQTPFHKTSSHSNMQSHRCVSPTFLPPGPRLTLSIPNKLTLYKLCIRPILTYAAPVWSNTSSYNYRRLQISQSKCLRVIGNSPRRTPIPP